MGLVLGTVTTASSATVPLGSVISQSPVGGTAVIPGSAVNLTVSSGPARPAGLVAAFGFDEANGNIAINSVNASFNGTIKGAIRTAGKPGMGRALWFAGTGGTNWVTVTDVTANNTLDRGHVRDDRDVVVTDLVQKLSARIPDTDTERGERLAAGGDEGRIGAPLPGGTLNPSGYVRLTESTADVGVRDVVPLPIGVWTHIATTDDGTNQCPTSTACVGTQPNPGSIIVAIGAPESAATPRGQ